MPRPFFEVIVPRATLMNQVIYETTAQTDRTNKSRRKDVIASQVCDLGISSHSSW